MTRTLDMEAVRQIARFAVGNLLVVADRYPDRAPAAEPEVSTALLCLASVSGGDYHAGYDKQRAEAWRAHYNRVRVAVTEESAGVDYRDGYAVGLAAERVVSRLTN